MMNPRTRFHLFVGCLLTFALISFVPPSSAISQVVIFNEPPPGPHQIVEGEIDPTTSVQALDAEPWEPQPLGEMLDQPMPPEILRQHTLAVNSEPGPLRLKAGDIHPTPGLHPSLVTSLEQTAALEGSFLYLVVQYQQRPTTAEAAQLSSWGYLELEMIPERAVIARVPTAKLSELAEMPFVRAVLPLQPSWKLDPNLAAEMTTLPQAAHAVRLVAFEPLDLEDEFIRLENSLVYQGELTSDQIRSYLENPLIQWIERAPQYETHLVTSAQVLGVDNLWGYGWDGDGVLVGVIDTGIMRTHPHWDVRGGFIYGTDWVDGGIPDDCAGHGTYVAGAISGSGIYQGQTFSGIAPESTVVVEKFLSCPGDPPADPWPTMEQVYDDVANLGARVINGSWGSDSNGQYLSDAQAADTWARDHPTITIVHSNGNGCFPSIPSESCVDDVSTPGLAKNVIAVGATMDGSPGSSIAAPPSAASASSVDLISALNNLNLPVDGRTKPDINAPGESITSSAITTEVYETRGGSSIAAPQIAGMIALKLQQVPGLRSDMIKAHLINSAVPLETKPNQNGFAEGWGRASALDFMYLLNGESIDTILTNVATQGSWQCSNFSIPSGGSYLLRTTMTYLDLAGGLNAAVARVNNLNLWIQHPSGAWGSAPGNTVETVENIVIPGAEAGSWNLCVEGQSVSGSQSYAVALSVIANGPNLTVDVPGIIALSDMASFNLDIELAASNWFAYGAYATVELTDPYSSDLQLDPDSRSGQVFGDMYSETKTWSPEFIVNTCDDLPDAIRVTIGATNFTVWTGLVDIQMSCPESDSYEPDNLWNLANWIYDNSPQTHSIIPLGDADWVKFTLTQRTGVVLETDGPSGDTELWLYDDGVGEVDYDDDLGNGYFSRIVKDCASEPLEAGLYYMKVAEYNNDAQIPTYDLTVTMTPCGDAYEPDDLSGEANWITLGTPQTHSIVPVSDSDWVKFNLTETTGVVLETDGPSGDTELWLFDDSLSQVDYDDDDGNGNFSRIVMDCASEPLEPGLYYVFVSEYGNNQQILTYDILVTGTPCGGGPDNFEPDDTPAQAKWIYSGTPQTHSLVPATDVDWVRFSLTGESGVILETSGESGDTYMELFDSDMNSITADDDAGNNLFSYIARGCVPPGTYYVKVNEYGSDAEIPSFDLDLTVNTGTCNHIYLPMILK
jgi:hypothetical protein